MKYLKIKTCFMFFLLCMCSALPVISSEHALNKGYELLFQANQAYKEDAYEKAAAAYEQLISRQAVGADILYNLGNCYVHLGQLGKAILNYERARRFMPRDPDLDFNLRYARARIKDRVDTSSSFSAFQWLDNFSRSEVFWSFAVINILFWATLILRLWIRSEWSFYLIMGLGLLWIIFGVSGGVKWYQETHDMRGVVIAPEINVHAGPDDKDTILFKLHAGTIVICEREEEDWRLIQLTPEKRGWTRAEGVEKIAEERLSIKPD